MLGPRIREEKRLNDLIVIIIIMDYLWRPIL